MDNISIGLHRTTPTPTPTSPRVKSVSVSISPATGHLPQAPREVIIGAIRDVCNISQAIRDRVRENREIRQLMKQQVLSHPSEFGEKKHLKMDIYKELERNPEAFILNFLPDNDKVLVLYRSDSTKYYTHLPGKGYVAFSVVGKPDEVKTTTFATIEDLLKAHRLDPNNSLKNLQTLSQTGVAAATPPPSRQITNFTPVAQNMRAVDLTPAISADSAPVPQVSPPTAATQSMRTAALAQANSRVESIIAQPAPPPDAVRQMILEGKAEDFANDLTALKILFYKAIDINEFDKKPDDRITVNRFIELNTNMTNFVASQILDKNLTPEQRKKVVRFFIDVAWHCFNKGDFDTALAIVSGINSSEISRLSSIKKLLEMDEKGKEKWKVLEEHFGSSYEKLGKLREQFESQGKPVIFPLQKMLKDVTNLQTAIRDASSENEELLQRQRGASKRRLEEIKLTFQTNQDKLNPPASQKIPGLYKALPRGTIPVDQRVMDSHRIEPRENTIKEFDKCFGKGKGKKKIREILSYCIEKKITIDPDLLLPFARALQTAEGMRFLKQNKNNPDIVKMLVNYLLERSKITITAATATSEHFVYNFNPLNNQAPLVTYRKPE